MEGTFKRKKKKEKKTHNRNQSLFPLRFERERREISDRASSFFFFYPNTISEYIIFSSLISR